MDDIETFRGLLKNKSSDIKLSYGKKIGRYRLEKGYYNNLV